MSHISYVCIIYITCASAMMCNGDAELTKLRSCLFSKRLHFAFLQLFWRVNQWTVYWESHLLQTAKEGTYIKIQWNKYWNLDWYWMKLLRKYNKQNPANSISSSTDDCKTYASEKPVQKPALLALALWCRLPSGVWTRAERVVAYFHNSGKVAKAGLSHGLWSHLSHRIAVKHC